MPMRTAVTCLLAALTSVSGVAAAERESELYRLYYDAEVLSFCGMASPRTKVGFDRRLAALIERDTWTDDGHRAVRRRAWVAAHREWNNRSLGGYKAWCDDEGHAALVRLLGYAGSSD